MNDDREHLRAENKRLQAELASQSSQLASQSTELVRQREASAKLQFYIRGLLRGRFGRSTEKLLDIPATDQQLIAEIEAFIAAERAERAAASTASVAPPEPPVTAGTPPAPASQPTSTSPPVAQRGVRQRPSAAFPKLEVRSTMKDLPEAERCDAAGTPLVRCGEQVVETVVFTQPEVFIDRTVYPRYRSTDETDAAGRVTTAGIPVPERIVDGGMLADATVQAIVIGKFADALPANRTLEIMARAGCRLSSSVIDAAVAACGDLLAPLALEIRNDLRRHAPVVGVDAAMMRCRDPELHRKCRRTPIYTVTDGTQAWYHWAPDETHAHANDVIDGFFRWLITDGWAGWRGATAIGARLAGCWAHARRPFARMEDDDPDAKAMVLLVHELYEIEDRADAADVSLTERARLRDRLSRPIVERIREFAKDLHKKHPGSGGHPCGGGARYILNQWFDLVKFLDHPELRLDNNLAEGDLRMVALIRKNSLFLGAASAGPRFAACLSVLRSCRLARINPADYLTDVTPTLIAWRRRRRANLPTPDLAELTPKRWGETHREKIRSAS